MTSNITLTQGSTVVTISTENVDEDLDNAIVSFPIPVVNDTKSSELKLINLKRITRTFTIRGKLSDSIVSGVTANTQRDRLLSIGRSNQSVSMAYANISDTPVSGYVRKFKITEVSQDKPIPSSYNVLLTFVDGTALVTS